jgi:hypothetical protein
MTISERGHHKAALKVTSGDLVTARNCGGQSVLVERHDSTVLYKECRCFRVPPPADQAIEKKCGIIPGKSRGGGGGGGGGGGAIGD